MVLFDAGFRRRHEIDKRSSGCGLRDRGRLTTTRAMSDQKNRSRPGETLAQSQ
jgi:hypothetical protein